MTEIPVATAVLVACFALIVMQEAVHGFHDCANAIAPAVCTNALAPRFAIPLAALCNFLGVVAGGTAITFECLGIPNATTHSYVGAILGTATAYAAVYHTRAEGVAYWDEGAAIMTSLFLAPVIAFVIAAALMLVLRSLAPAPPKFADYALWVTRYRPDELDAAGRYPNQAMGGDGLPRFAARDESIVDTDVVLWHTFGITHIPRVEDWPVMPVHRAGFILVPDAFFARNPALDVPPPAH